MLWLNLYLSFHNIELNSELFSTEALGNGLASKHNYCAIIVAVIAAAAASHQNANDFESLPFI